MNNENNSKPFKVRRIICYVILLLYFFSYLAAKIYYNQDNALEIFQRFQGLYADGNTGKDIIHQSYILCLLETVKFEFLPAAIVIGVMLGSWILKSRLIKYLTMFPVLIATVFYCSDLGAMEITNSRFNLGDAVDWIIQLPAYWDLTLLFFGKPIGFYTIYLILLVILFYNINCDALLAKRNLKTVLLIWLSVSGISLVVYLWPMSASQNTKAQNYFNIYQIYYQQDHSRYSKDYEPLKKFSINWQTDGQVDKKKNIIVLEVESLSNGISNYFSGINDYVPEFDKIARNGVSYTNYYGNGWSTAFSMFAMFTGYDFFFGNMKKENSNFYDHSFIRFLQKHGYYTKLFHTEYLSDNIFGIRDLYETIEFNTISNRNDDYYSDFSSEKYLYIPDNILFDYVLDFIDKSHEPFVFFVSTMATHEPFLIPGTNTFSYPGVFHCFDAALRSFVDALEQNGFFDNGILVITGDHHPRAAVTDGEIEKYGDTARLMVPLVIYDGHNKGTVSEPVGHNSLGAIITHAATGMFETHQFMQNPHNPDPNHFIFFQGYWPRNLVHFYYHGHDYRIKLNGDKTKFIDEPPAEINVDEVLGYIAWIRTRR